ncbi:hypothetical protein N7475_002642, partial [Penicillium sp. IBT 31633x]
IIDFVRGNRVEILDDFKSFNSFSAKISKDLIARLKSHKDIEGVEIDLFATYQLALREEAPASPTLDNIKVTYRKWADKRDGLYNESKDKLPVDLNSLLRQAGSATYQGSKIFPDNIDRFKYYNLITTLAPNKSEGPDDKLEWNLFKEYLNSSV